MVSKIDMRGMDIAICPFIYNSSVRCADRHEEDPDEDTQYTCKCGDMI